jgi:hypothetical protein
MTEPAVIVLDDDPAELDELRLALERRYGQAYLVVCESSPAVALRRLGDMIANYRPVAIVCAPTSMLDSDGGEFLSAAHRLCPTAKPSTGRGHSSPGSAGGWMRRHSSSRSRRAP